MKSYTTFTGTNAEYARLHRWVKKQLGKPTVCEQCGRDASQGISLHWANISGEYRQDTSDWARLCATCHGRFDNPTKTFCQRGHSMVESNIYVHPNGSRMCKECKRLTRKVWRHKKREEAIRNRGHQ